MSEPNPAGAASDLPGAGLREMPAPVIRIRGGTVATCDDWVAVERPLEIRARLDGEVSLIATTMRTPGDDRALAAGFLYGERVIRDAGQLLRLEALDDDTVLVELDTEAARALQAARRPFLTTGACGVCGHAHLERLFELPARGPDRRIVPHAILSGLPEALRAAQATFARTGGLHAAGLFSAEGASLAVFEDVGRHNAVDKLVGARLLDGRLPDPDAVLVVSGRASFELAQKTAVAGFGTLIAVGAPSSLAVEIARRAGMTLIGFARADGFNVYCGAERVEGIEAAGESDG
jgi:FdhD protein